MVNCRVGSESIMMGSVASEHHNRRSRRWLVAAVALAVVAPILAACEPPVPATSAVFDAFERPDGAGLGTAQTGQVWSTDSGSPSLVSGKAALGPGAAMVSVESNRSDGVASTRVATDGNEFWLVVRMSDDQNYWRFGRANGGPYVLQQIQGNQIGGAAVESLSTRTAQPLDRLSCRLAGDAITCSIDGVPVARVTDDFNATATRHGLSTWQSPETRFEEFRVGEPVVMADLSVSVAAPGQVQVGTGLEATGTFTNEGLAPLSNAVATWSVGANATTFSGTSPAGPCTRSGQALTCPIGDLGVGQSRSVAISVTAPSTEGPLALMLSGSHPAPDEQDANGIDWVTVTVTDEPPPQELYDVFDDFARPDGVGLGTAPTGQAWTTHAGTPSIAGQAAAMGDGSSLASVPSTLSDGVVSATVSSPGSELWLVVRMTDDQNYWRFGRTAGGAYVLRQVVAGSSGSPVLDVRATVVPEAGDRLSCRLTSTSIGCSVDGVLVVSTSDGFNRTATRHGLAAWSSPLVAFDDFAVAELPNQPDLRTTLSGPTEVRTGGSLHATATVINDGRAPATDAAVEWTVPEGLTDVSGSASGGGCTLADAVLRCPVGNLAPGATASAVLTALAPTSSGSVLLAANAVSTTADAEPADNSTSVFVAVTGTPSDAVVFDPFDRPDGLGLGVAVTGQPWVTHYGAPFLKDEQASLGYEYGLVSIDSGRSNGVVSATMPSIGSEFWLVVRLSDDANFWRFGRQDDGPYLLQRLQGGMVVESTIETLSTTIACAVDGTVVARTEESFNRTATRHGMSTYHASAQRFDDFTVRDLPIEPDLLVTLSGTRAVEVGGAVDLTTTVVNAGSTPATSTAVHGTLPPGLDVASVTPSQGSCSVAGSTFDCSLGTLPGGTAANIVLAAAAPASPGVIVTSVQGSHAGDEANPVDDQASWSTTVRPPTALGAFMSDGFDRPTGSPLGTTDTGQPWTIHHGGFQIDGGRAAPTGASNFASIDGGFEFGTYDLTLAAGASERWAIVFRVVDPSNYYRLTTNSTTGTYDVEKVVDGAPTSVAVRFVRAGVSPQNGDAIRIVLQPDDSIYVYVNGEQIIDSGDQQFVDATGFGFVTHSTAPRFDDLRVSSVVQAVPVFDTFSRPDATDLGTPEVGTRIPWRTWVGSPWGVDGGAAYHPGLGYSMTAVNASSEAASVRARFTALGSEQWVVFRHAEAGSYYRFGGLDGGAYQVQFVTPSGVTTTVPIEQVSSVPLSPGDLVEVVQRIDGRVETYVNGVLTHRFTDLVTNRRATNYGMATSGSLARIDDFAVALPVL
jgi:uncharacterized repeat protein (TIGR01451 family)